ncbi:MAG TPA: SPOR domain-containing protein [Patescibacteria group bacterium]|nr:SPOR domain-containing protein [Patescibacteria group bacterium]
MLYQLSYAGMGGDSNPRRRSLAGGRARLEAGVGSLVLLGEVETPPSADAAEVGAVPVPMPDVPGCLTLGPFATPAELRGYRVYLPASGSREAALAAARQLATRGVRDYYVVTAGDQENTISLGLFRDGDNAARRRDEVKALGLDVQLSERTEDTPEYWLDYAVSPAQQFDWRDRVPDRLELSARDLPCGQLR